MDATDFLASVRLLPVVTIDDADTAVPLAQALCRAGVVAIEVTLRTNVALTAMERIAREVPELRLGAGSVRHVEHFARIRDAGCSFAVSPGATDALLDAAGNLPYVPGAATASESLRLLARGYCLQKFFPAEASGGADALRALAQPLPEVRFCPTGGVNANNALKYLELSSVACVGGSWFVARDALAARDFDQIEANARAAVELTRSGPPTGHP